MESAQQELVIVTTVSDAEEARSLARGLLDARLAACVSCLPGARSFFRWKSEEITEEHEHVLLIKTHRSRLAQIEQFFAACHPYECPEFLVIEADAISPDYRAWMHRELGLESN